MSHTLNLMNMVRVYRWRSCYYLW